MRKITKGLILSFVVLMGLASCNTNGISEEQARARAQAIKQEQEKESFKFPKKFYIEEKTKNDMTITVDGAKRQATSGSDIAIHIDSENQTFFFSMYVIDDSMENMPVQVDTKTWCYIEDGFFISATESGDNKVYTSTKIDDSFNFAEKAGIMYVAAYEELKGSDYLDVDSYKEVSNDLAELYGLTFQDVNVTFTSTGDGNLGVSQSGSLNMNMTIGENKIYAKGTNKGTILFDNYFLSSIQISTNIDYEFENQKIHSDGSTSVSVHLNVTKFSKPNLSSFTKSE